MVSEVKVVVIAVVTGLAIGLGAPFVAGLYAGWTERSVSSGLLMAPAMAGEQDAVRPCDELYIYSVGGEKATLADIKRCLFTP